MKRSNFLVKFLLTSSTISGEIITFMFFFEAANNISSGFPSKSKAEIKIFESKQALITVDIIV